MKQTTRLVPAVLFVLAAAGCDAGLSVDNLVNPDVERVFATPAAIEQTIASGYQGCHNANANNNLMPQVLTLALESYSQLNNFFMGPRGGIPRSPVTNIRGTDGTHFNNFSSYSRGGRLSVNALNALDKLITDGGTLGTAAQNLRARSFAFFVVACNQGWLAMTFDSAGIVAPGLASDIVPPLAGAKDVMINALALLDSAIAIANLPAAALTGGFPMPDT